MKIINFVFLAITERFFLFILGILIAIVGVFSPLRAYYGLYKIGQEMNPMFRKGNRLTAKDIMNCKDC